MARFLFFLLVVANGALAAHLWMVQQRPADEPLREIQPQALKVVGVVDAVAAARDIERFATDQRALAAGPCVEIAGVGVNGAPRAQELLVALGLTGRIAERRVEEFTKFAVYIPALANRRLIDETIAQLKARNINDYQVLGDNSVSIGVFATEEAANRHLADMERKGVKNAKVGGRARELKDIVLSVSQPDLDLAGRLLLTARDLPGARLTAAACPVVTAEARP
jgi:hypothetical protein